jgi:NAD(P)-dependent dehydrogenase (short-subunit alcohol dehydrogenase family)
VPSFAWSPRVGGARRHRASASNGSRSVTARRFGMAALLMSTSRHAGELLRADVPDARGSATDAPPAWRQNRQCVQHWRPAGIIHESSYCASKFALCGWSEALVVDLHGTGVSMKLIEPGPVDRDLGKRTISGRASICRHLCAAARSTSLAREQVSVPAIQWTCFTSCRRQAPTLMAGQPHTGRWLG